MWLPKFTNLTLSWRRSPLYRNQCIDLKSKSMDWFLYEMNLNVMKELRNVRNTKTIYVIKPAGSVHIDTQYPGVFNSTDQRRW